MSEKEAKLRNSLGRVGNYSAEIGLPIANFSVKDINGLQVSENDLKGKITFINFWFDGCSWCHQQFRNLNALYEKYEHDSSFQLISFTFDNYDLAKRNVEKYGLLYQVASVDQELIYKLNFKHGFPTNYLVGEDGKVLMSPPYVSENKSNAFGDFIYPKIDSLLYQLKIDQWENLAK